MATNTNVTLEAGLSWTLGSPTSSRTRALREPPLSIQAPPASSRGGQTGASLACDVYIDRVSEGLGTRSGPCRRVGSGRLLLPTLPANPCRAPPRTQAAPSPAAFSRCASTVQGIRWRHRRYFPWPRRFAAVLVGALGPRRPTEANGKGRVYSGARAAPTYDVTTSRALSPGRPAGQVCLEP
jgi:hypothetical protein